MSNQLFLKPKGVRYVTMAIYIDDNIYSDNRDDSLIFKYMYLLAYMLASKQRYFHNSDDYDGFAYYLALQTYYRMIDTKKVRIKSVLNYMKSIMYFRKMLYEKDTFKEIINPEFEKTWDSDEFRDNSINNLQTANSEIIKIFVNNILNNVHNIIKECIPIVYKSDILLYNNLYTSSLLTMLYRLTLNTKISAIALYKKLSATKFDDVNFYLKHIDKDSIILWLLPSTMGQVVKLIINKTNSRLKSEISDTIADFRIDEDEYTDMSNDFIFSGEEDEYT